MTSYLKYAWPSEGQFITDMISSGFAETIDGETTFINCFVHQIGSVCISQDAEGNCTSYDPRYAVDIIWEVPSEYNQYVVWPEPGSAVHWFAGWESQYATDFCEANPTSPYCTLSTDI
jgi:hypothetical protein